LDRREFFGAALVRGRLTSAVAAEPASLPHGRKAVWDLDKAHREKTATRERWHTTWQRILDMRYVLMALDAIGLAVGFLMFANAHHADHTTYRVSIKRCRSSLP
jgi:hypothetical protein